MGLLDEIRAACQQVAKNPQYVFINYESLDYYAKSLNFAELKKPVYDSYHHLLADDNSTLAYIIVLNSINFGSGYFPNLKKNDGMSGYFTIAYNLKEYFVEHGSFSPQELTHIKTTQLVKIFKQENNPQIIDLMDLFTKALNDLGDYTLAEFGSFSKLILAAKNSAEQLAEILAKMPLFKDEYVYNSFRLPIYKRAQIMASDLALAFANKGYGQFDDLDKLTIFADNLVPHVLRLDGVLEYSSELAKNLENQEMLESGSKQEIEIRAVSLHACELIAKILNVPARELDILLWNKGQDLKYREIARHRTRTSFY